MKFKVIQGGRSVPSQAEEQRPAANAELPEGAEDDSDLLAKVRTRLADKPEAIEVDLDDLA